MSRLAGKRIIVTGSTYGLGAAIAEALVEAGATVATMARSADLGHDLARELTVKGPGAAAFHRCDVSVRTEVEEAFTAAVDDMGGLDGLVHAAGVEGGGRPQDQTDEEWDRVFDINAKGTFLTNQAAFPHLSERGGPIVNFGSGVSLSGAGASAVYAASKGAVAAWTRSLAQAWGSYEIRVNCICPAVRTPMYEEHRARMTTEQLARHDDRMAEMIHLGGRLGDAEQDLAPVVVFLCSDDSRFITGQMLCVDGGVQKAR